MEKPKESGAQNHLLEILQNRKPVINQKLKRCVEFKLSPKPKNSQSYTENTPKEELVLEHVIQFKKQFQHHTDENRELFIYPKNESDVYKFICTTVRPTKLGFLELYDYKTCAEYMSRFVQYEQLDPPDQFPRCIPSPANVARWQKGDCFDMSILLSSLLIGVGYDAYCVYGIAPKEITTKNEALMECDFLNRGTIEEDDEDKKDERIVEEYMQIQRRKKIESEFDTKKQEQQRQEKEEMARKALTIDDDEPDELAPDLFLGRRIHCWVLLKKGGKRGLQQDVFIEPSTGRIYDTKSSPYLLVDAIFNHTNFWIHMQPKHRVEDIKFELYETMAWEYVMLHDELFRNNEQDEAHDLDEQGGISKLDHEQDKLKDLAQTLDMPPPWSPKIYIDKDQFLKGTPLGESTVFYIKVKVEKYADYNQPDGLVQKITIYEDYKKMKIKEIRCFYKHRSDKLEIKRRFPFLYKSIEQYGPGKMPHWRQIITVDQRIRIIRYYPNRNSDGLIKRIEKIGEKTVEYYENRQDRVVSRSIRFILADDKKSTKDYVYMDNYMKDVVVSKDLLMSKDSKESYKELNKEVRPTEVRITKMTIKYEKNPKKPANEQIAKLSIDLQKYQITASFHMNEGEISPITKVYSRDQIMGISKSDNQKKIDDPVTQQENQSILALEKDCFKYMRQRQEIAANETKQMRQPIALEQTLYDKARAKFKQNQNKEDDEQEEENADDFLRPYLEKRNLPINGVLEASKAKQIKEEVMKKLKERIIARARIIQERLVKQQQALKQQEQLYQKKQQDKNDKELADIKFRIGILQSRSARFQSIALHRYQQLDHEISKDPRMAALKDDKK